MSPSLDSLAGLLGWFFSSACIEVAVANSSCDSADVLKVKIPMLKMIAIVLIIKIALIVESHENLKIVSNYSRTSFDCKA